MAEHQWRRRKWRFVKRRWGRYRSWWLGSWKKYIQRPFFNLWVDTLLFFNFMSDNNKLHMYIHIIFPCLENRIEQREEEGRVDIITRLNIIYYINNAFFLIYCPIIITFMKVYIIYIKFPLKWDQISISSEILKKWLSESQSFSKMVHIWISSKWFYGALILVNLNNKIKHSEKFQLGTIFF